METLSTPGGSSSVIVAVIDTGVDYDHEDLAGNIWVNENEIPDDGIDNDGNGYVDDYYGVNIVTGTGNGDDDNGHGTHVAGIIAARNNNLGTVGTASSIAVQDALAMAYADCVLVASAGNDGAPNEGIGAIPNYPAALSYVLGVMSVDSSGQESAFSNYDTYQFNGVEYELYAPGEYMLSTIPGDGYASWSGTSMASPVVAAMAALLRSEYPDAEMYPTKFLYGQLSATSGHNADCLDVRGTLEGCIFADSALNFYQYGYTVRDCVFLGNCVGIETWDRTAIATTLQIPVPERQYNANLERATHYPAWNENFFVSTQNSPMTRQLMEELGYSPVTIDSDEMAQWLYEYIWDVLSGYASRFDSPEPAAGVTYEWLYAVPDLELTEEELNGMLNDAYAAPDTHPKFQGNVILNRISTDFDPNHWLRIEAPGGSGEEIPPGGNYWGTTDERAIGLQIVDYSDFPAAYSLLNYKPFLTDAPGIPSPSSPM